MIGQTLDRYRIEAKLGQGGMGDVYKVRDTHLDRVVAIKVLPAELVADAERKQRFVQEARAASALNHPHIVAVYDVRSDAGIDFIVIEYADGRTLNQLLSTTGLTLRRAWRYASQIADSLACAHEAGIVHRDLKPSNVIVTPDGRVKVLDFGVAKRLDRGGHAATQTSPITGAGTAVGTTAYMSPEQAEGTVPAPTACGAPARHHDQLAWGLSPRRVGDQPGGVFTEGSRLVEEEGLPFNGLACGSDETTRAGLMTRRDAKLDTREADIMSGTTARPVNGGRVLLCVLMVFEFTAQAAAQAAVEIAASTSFLEGPTTDRDGNVYFTDMVNERIMKLSADGTMSTFREKSNVANGLLIDPQGRLVACEGAVFERPGVKRQGQPRVTRTDLKTGAVEVLADGYQGKPLIGPNDVTIDGNGRLYFTELNGAAVYRIDGPGRIVRILSAPDVMFPNGIQVSPDNQTLYVVEAGRGAKDRREIRAFDLSTEGSAANPRTLYNFHPGRSADGISIDVEGNLYASAGMNQRRGTSETLDTKTGVYVISPAGRLLTFIPIPEDLISNNGFGGPDMKTLYVTAGKTLFRLRTTVAGLPR